MCDWSGTARAQSTYVSVTGARTPHARTSAPIIPRTPHGLHVHRTVYVRGIHTRNGQTQIFSHGRASDRDDPWRGRRSRVLLGATGRVRQVQLFPGIWKGRRRATKRSECRRRETSGVWCIWRIPVVLRTHMDTIRTGIDQRVRTRWNYRGPGYRTDQVAREPTSAIQHHAAGAHNVVCFAAGRRAADDSAGVHADLRFWRPLPSAFFTCGCFLGRWVCFDRFFAPRLTHCFRERAGAAFRAEDATRTTPSTSSEPSPTGARILEIKWRSIYLTLVALVVRCGRAWRGSRHPCLRPPSRTPWRA